jgi:hypothetical protein
LSGLTERSTKPIAVTGTWRPPRRSRVPSSAAGVPVGYGVARRSLFTTRRSSLSRSWSRRCHARAWRSSADGDYAACQARPCVPSSWARWRQGGTRWPILGRSTRAARLRHSSSRLRPHPEMAHGNALAH